MAANESAGGGDVDVIAEAVPAGACNKRHGLSSSLLLLFSAVVSWHDVHCVTLLRVENARDVFHLF